MMDNDEFLYTLRQTPRASFVNELQAKLDGPVKATRFSMLRARVGWAVAVTCLTMMGFVVVSPEARAEAMSFINGILITTFGKIEMRTIDDFDLSGRSLSQQKAVSITEAQLIFPFNMPTWVPDGFRFEGTVSLISDRYYKGHDKDMFAALRWTREEDEGLIFLTIMKDDTPQMVVGSANNAREIMVGTTPGVLYRGAWTDGHYIAGPGSNMNLVWTTGGISYMMGSQATSEVDLIRMAASME